MADAAENLLDVEKKLRSEEKIRLCRRSGRYLHSNWYTYDLNASRVLK